MIKVAVIDGDSICYLSSKETIEESLKNVDTIMHSIIKETGSSHYYLFLSMGPYFRHIINPEYKNKRKNTLKYINTLKSYLRERYFAVYYPKVEADDMVAYIMNNFNSKEMQCISCSIDKDVINQVVGHHFNYRTHKFSKTSFEDARKFLYTQVLTGDATDNISGIKGIGEVKAEKLLTNKDYNSICLKAYVNHFKSAQAIFEFQKNFRQVYLLKTQEDFIREIGHIPEWPTLIKYNQNESNNTED